MLMAASCLHCRSCLHRLMQSLASHPDRSTPPCTGGVFDPFGFSKGDENLLRKYKENEIKNGRLAMVHLAFRLFLLPTINTLGCEGLCDSMLYHAANTQWMTHQSQSTPSPSWKPTSDLQHVSHASRPGPIPDLIQVARCCTQVAFLGFIFQHAAYPGKGPIQNLVVSCSTIALLQFSYCLSSHVCSHKASCSAAVACLRPCIMCAFRWIVSCCRSFTCKSCTLCLTQLVTLLGPAPLQDHLQDPYHVTFASNGARSFCMLGRPLQRP